MKDYHWIDSMSPDPGGGVVAEQGKVVGGPRARYREQVRAEVQAHAWEQIADAGASALSLKAIAMTMGITAPALYRYFAGRDELLTDLILEAYRDLAEVVEAASAVDEKPQHTLRAIATALRRWATAHPQRYLLLYGTPVPGYSAPPEAAALATRIFAPLLTAFAAADRERTGRGATGPTGRRTAAALLRSTTFWTRLHGVLSLELAGHFDGMNVDAELLYDQEASSAISLDG